MGAGSINCDTEMGRQMIRNLFICMIVCGKPGVYAEERSVNEFPGSMIQLPNNWIKSLQDVTVRSQTPSVQGKGILCVLTSRRKVSYLQTVLRSLDYVNASEDSGFWRSAVVDVDSSTGVLDADILHPLDRRIESCSGESDVEGLPSCEVRQQTTDVANTLEKCSHLASQWVTLVEDDTVLCKGGLKIMEQSLQGLGLEVDAVKFAKCFSGTTFRVSSLNKFTHYARSVMRTLPVDIALHGEWGSGKVPWGYNLNLFHHVGDVSTFEARNSKEFRQRNEKVRKDKCLSELSG